MASQASTPPFPLLLRSFSEAEEDSTCSVHPPFLPFLSLSLSLALLSSSPALHLFLSFSRSVFLSLSQPRVVPSSRQPSSVSLVLLDTNGQSKLRHYEVPCTEVTPLQSHHFGSTNTAATLGRSLHLESGERGPPLPPPPTIQLYGGSRGAPELTPPLS